IFTALIEVSLSGSPAGAGQPVQPTEIAAKLEPRGQRLLFEILFEDAGEPTWEEALSCVEVLRHRQTEMELADVQHGIEANPAGPQLRGLLERKQQLMRRLAAGAK